MKLKISRAVVWAATIEDRPAGLAEKVEPVAEAGANLEFILARRTLEQPGTGVVFVSPLKGAAQIRAAKAAGFLRTESLHSVRVEGPNQRGSSARLTRALATSEINLRGFSAAAIGKSSVAYLAFDDVDDATKAMRILRRLA